MAWRVKRATGLPLLSLGFWPRCQPERQSPNPIKHLKRETRHGNEPGGLLISKKGFVLTPPDINSAPKAQHYFELLDPPDFATLPHPGNLAVALDLVRNGFAVFPCKPDKTPLTARGFKDATNNPAAVLSWWTAHPDALPALPTGARNGIAVLDLDRHHAGQDGFAALRDLGLDPATLSPATVDTPNAGHHLYFGHAEGVTTSGRHLPKGVDVRGEGGYVIAPGAVLPDGRVYRPTRPLDRNALPAWPAALLPPARDDENLTAQCGDAPPVDWPEVRRALPFIDPDCDRDTWIRVGMALHAASEGSAKAFELWDTWSADAVEPGKYVARSMAGQWRSFARRVGVDIGTLFHIAAEFGWTRGPQIDADDFDDLPSPPTPTPSALTFLSPADCEASPARGYTIKGFIAPGDVACIFGAPGAGKSLIAPHLGYAVAQGRATFGMRAKAGGVFYVAAEDPHGMRGRIRALKDEYGDADRFHLVEGVSNLLAEKSPDLLALVDAVKERRPALIVVDTLAMAFPGLEENDAKSMGRIVAVARTLARWGAAVVLIHHDTKAEGATPRGHSILNGALDVALHVKRDENGVIRGRLTKNRNGTCERDIAFKIEVEECGFDEDGDAVTLPRCFELLGSPLRDTLAKLSRPERVSLSTLGELGTATRKRWREATVTNDALTSGEAPEARTKAFNRAVASLTEKRLIRVTDGVYSQDDGFDPIDPVASSTEDDGT